VGAVVSTVYPLLPAARVEVRVAVFPLVSVRVPPVRVMVGLSGVLRAPVSLLPMAAMVLVNRRVLALGWLA
jgi:hypothetical protein